MKVFDQYARYYDLLYRDKDYRGETDFVLSLLQDHAPGSKRIFEMGCGTGIHAQMLAEAGHTVHGIDFSDTMLATAAERRQGLAAELQERLSFDSGDVRTYRAGRSFDVVLSLFHVFSYQTANADLQAAFATAASHLNSGGVFIFDYWYGPAVLVQRPETRIKRMQDGGLSILRMAESNVDDIRNVVEVNYETIVTVEGFSESIFESHKMRYLFIPEIQIFAENNGFEAVNHRAWMAGAVPSFSSWSVCSVLKKL